MYITSDEEINGAEVYYADASKPVLKWKKAYAPVYDSVNGRYSTSIIGLEENTEYYVRAVAQKSGNTEIYNISSVTTWTSAADIAEDKSLEDVYGGSGTLVIDGYNSDSGYVRIFGGVINGGEENEAAVEIKNSKNVILENLTVTGGKRYGIHIGAGCENIKIINCDISGWGRTGELALFSGDSENNYSFGYLDSETGEAINYDAGIYLDRCGKITAERNYIHSPRGNTTAWTDSADSYLKKNSSDEWEKVNGNIKWTFSHPKGMCGMYARDAYETVIRYNDIAGNEEHRFNDGIEGYGNTKTNGGLSRDCDIYGNYIAFGQDDGIELDGGGANVRFHNNRITNFYSGISAAGIMVGPAFVYNNVIHNLRDSTDYSNLHIKNGTDPKTAKAEGIINIFYNTFFAESGRRDYGIAAVGYYNAVTANNVIVGGQLSRPQVKNYAPSENFCCVSSYDYDILGNWRAEGGRGVIDILDGSAKEENAVFGIPDFKSWETGNFALNEGSIGYESAVNISGFKGINAGAVDVNSSGMIPSRPIGITSDKYIVRLQKGESADITLSSELEITAPFTVLSNDGCTDVSVIQGDIAPKGQTSLAVTDKCSHSSPHDETLFIRFNSGMTIPILIRIN